MLLFLLMSRVIIFCILIFTLSIIGFLFFEVVLPTFGPHNGGLSVKINKTGKVYLEGKYLGQTPFLAQNLKTGDQKLEIRAGDEKLLWDGNVTLSNNTLSLLELELGAGPLFTAGENLNFRSASSTSLTLLSLPVQATLKIDTKTLGLLPIQTEVRSGIHNLKITSAGFLDRAITVNVETGYRLSGTVYLAANPFEKIEKISATESLSLFAISNSVVDLSRDYLSWVDTIKNLQQSQGETETKFDALLDPTGKIYYLDQESWEKKVKARSPVNIGYLQKGNASLTTAASAAFTKMSQMFQ